jgi:hypothetical protein
VEKLAAVDSANSIAIPFFGISKDIGTACAVDVLSISVPHLGQNLAESGNLALQL